MEIPYIESRENGYSLFFEMPTEEYEPLKKVLNKINQKHFEKYVKSIFERNAGKEIPRYPYFNWSDLGELLGFHLGIQCACVQSEYSSSKVSFHFHNIDFSYQAETALQVLAVYFNGLKHELSEKLKVDKKGL